MANVIRARVSRCIRLVAAAVLAVLLAPPVTPAAPFCVQTQAIPPQCIFVDAGSCNERATQMGGTCYGQSRRSAGVPRIGPLLSAHVLAGLACIYADRGACDREAQHQHGVCVDAPSTAGEPTRRSVSTTSGHQWPAVSHGTIRP